MHKSPGDSSREDCRVIYKLFWNQVISWNVMELTTMSVVCPFPPSFGIAKMASNLKNPHFIKDKSTSKSGFMSGLQHAVYNINPEETVMTWQFSEFYILLSASMLIRKSGIHTCVWGRTSHALPLFVPSYDTSLCFNSRACLGGPNSICECSVRPGGGGGTAIYGL